MKYIFVILLSVLPLWAEAQEAWTLQRCIEHAKAQNLDLKIQRNNERKSVYDFRQSKWDLAPSISASSNGSINFKRATDADYNVSSGTSYNISYSLGSSITLFAGFTKLNTIAAARFAMLATGEAASLSEIMLEINVSSLFSQTLYQKALAEVANKRLETSRFEAQRIAATIETGQMEAVAQNEIDAVVSANLLEYNKAINSYKLLKLQLMQMIELPQGSSFEIDGAEFELSEPEALALDTDSLYAETCIGYPLVLQTEYELEYYRKALNIARGSHSPIITASGGYSSGFYSTDTIAGGKPVPVGTQFNKYLNPSLGASLNIPIFDGKRRTYSTKKSRIDVENAMFRLENQKKQLRKELEEAVLKLHSLQLEYMSARDNLTFAERSFETCREKYQLGMINTTDFMNVQNLMSQAAVNLLLARYSWIVQRMTIDLYTLKRQ
ncbi:MAG: TolC family protein [Cytophagaceae bacterium]|jgi:outer membrane protein|nr:TolC family protein [Cytophagaceae bacterium]